MRHDPSSSPAPANALEAVTHPDPYPYYARLAAAPSLVRDETLHLWIAASAASVSAVLSHPAARVRPAAERVPRAIAGSAAGSVFGALVRMSDGEAHTRMRPAIQAALQQVDLAALGRRTRTLAAQSLGTTALTPEAVSAWLFALPVCVMADRLGFPATLLPTVAAWTRDFVACLSPRSDAAQLAAASAAAAHLTEALGTALRETDAEADTLCALLRREADQRGWDDAGARAANALGLLSQTYEATAGLLGNAWLALHSVPGLREALDRGEASAQGIVEEVARHDPPVQNTRRFFAEPIEIGGCRVEADSTVLVVLAAANRDPRANPEPERFLVDRPARRSFTFGLGAHACPGQALACTMARAALEVLLEAGAVDRAAGWAWTYRPSVNARLPVFHAA